MQTRLLTIAEAAERLAISRAHLYRLIGDGRIQAVRIGSSRRISEQEVEAFIARLTDER